MLTRSLSTLAVAAIAAAACGARVQHAIPIAVVIDGDRAAIGALPSAVDGLALHELAVPAPAPPPADDAGAAVTRARAAYVHGDLDACRRELEHVDVTAELAAGDRAIAARALAFDAACAWAATAKADAEADAARLASCGLELPEAAVAPDVETLLGDAIAASGRAPRSAIAVTGQVGARLRIDGRDAGCAIPCKLDLAPGDHVVAADADGFEPAAQRVRTPDVTQIAIVQAVASPELRGAAMARAPGSRSAQLDATGASLMARFGGERRIAWLHGDARLSGGLVIDGVVVARSDVPRGDARGLVRELAYDGGILVRPPVWQRPWFWIAASAVAIAIAGGVVALTYTPPIRTSGGF